MKYPIYIISKGRYDNALTANKLKEYKVPFKIVVDPEEYNLYCDNIGYKYVLKLPFSNLGLGSYPARNFCWDHSLENGHLKHWIFDDNIRHFVKFNKGKRVNCDPKIAIRSIEDFSNKYINLAIIGFNYRYFVTSNTRNPFSINTHVYSALLIDNSVPYRWRLKYNEDVDLCLQVLDAGLCTVLVNAFLIDKTSTTVKMKGGNQSELYQNNAESKKWLKSKSLESVWPQYVRVVRKYNRWHHQVSWKKHFKQSLIKH